MMRSATSTTPQRLSGTPRPTNGTTNGTTTGTTNGTTNGTTTRTVGVPGRAVVTYLTPAERARVEAVGHDCCRLVHRDSLDQLLLDLRTQPVSAVIVSVSRYLQQPQAASVARLVREFPRIPAVALLTASEGRTTQAVLALGQQGVRTLVDAREPAGWRDLRQLVSRPEGSGIERLAIQRIHEDLEGACPAALRFFEMLFTVPPTLTTVRELARAFGVRPTTFMTRFFRAGLPAAKKYLAYARLVRAAQLFENPGVTVTQVAFQLEYSSPQSFSRHLHGLLRIGTGEFRRQYTGERMLERLREDLVRPHREALQHFDPCGTGPLMVRRTAADQATRRLVADGGGG